ncbi:MAG TPA: hypothetical protein VJ183_18280 [Chloroflexia bacterium]|nr:hypothetical protein [Chloroflexia bacterium]
MMNHKSWIAPFTATFMLLLVGVVATLATASAQPLAAQTDPPGCWAVYPQPADNSYRELHGVAALSASDVWAVGYQSGLDSPQTLITHWDGKAWNAVPSPSEGLTRSTLSGVAAISPTDVWAVGSSGLYDRGEVRTLVMHWDGRVWSVIPSPNASSNNNELKAVAAVSKDDVWAVGNYTIPNGANSTLNALILHWDGTRWTQSPAPHLVPMAQLNGVTAISRDDVWAVGGGNEETFQALALHWDGTEWSAVPTVRLPQAGYLNAVSAAGPDDVWAVGMALGNQTGNNPTETLTLHWNGKEWSRVASPNAERDVRSWSILNSVVTLPGREVWAFGAFNQNKTPSQPLLMRWNGSAWSLVSSPIRTFTTNLLGATVSADGSIWTVGSRSSPTIGNQEGLALRHTSTPCASTPTPIATMAPPVPLPGTNNVTFPETGKTLSGIFRDYWKAHGGLIQQGFAISNLLGEVSDLNGKPYTMQYFERAVFEYHPENQPPYNVLLSQLGRFEYLKRYSKQGAPNQRPNTSAGSILFPETGKRLGGKFLQYWRDNGGLMQQGFPLSDEFEEVSPLNGKRYTVQYFERAVFEAHPENQPPFDVLLSHIGRFRYNQQYNSAASATIVASNIGNAVAGGKFIFWEDRGLPNNPIYGFDNERATQALVTEKPGYKFEMATDGTHVTWIAPDYTFTQSATLDGLHIGTGASFSIPITSGISVLAIENGVLYYYWDIEGGMAIHAHDIATGNKRPLVVHPFRTLPNGSRTSDVLVSRVLVKDGVLLWSESRYRPDTPPTDSETSLHMLKLDGTMGDTVLATARGNLRGFDLSGDNVVWTFSPLDLADPPDPSNRVTLYNIRTGVKRAISPEGIRASDPIIRGNLVVWSEGTSTLPFIDRKIVYNTLMKVYDIETGSTHTLFRQNTFVAPLAIVGNALAFTQYDRIRDTTGLYLVELPAAGATPK